jgi:hypothetical protein
MRCDDDVASAGSGLLYLCTDWVMRHPGNERLLHVGKDSAPQNSGTARLRPRTVTGEAPLGGCSEDHKNRR